MSENKEGSGQESRRVEYQVVNHAFLEGRRDETGPFFEGLGIDTARLPDLFDQFPY